MITRHHVALTVLCTVILCSALVPVSPVLILLIGLGAGIGAILPDIQTKKPNRLQVRTLAWMITRFGCNLCTPLICRAYLTMNGQSFQPGDKRLTHSIPGILLLWAILAGILLIPAAVIMSRAAWYLPAAFIGGVMLGTVLHLVEDLCTRKGITPFFPFSAMKISGSIRPCDTIDRRIAQFHYYHCSVAGIFLGFRILGTWQGLSVLPLCIFGLGSCLGMMIWSSDVEISHEPTGNGNTPGVHPVLADQDTIPKNPDNTSSGLLMGVYYFNKSERWNYEQH